MTITATFSNGFTDTYKGKRAVTAAWAIIERATGEVVMSGHSINLPTAQKTAASNISAYFARGNAVPRPDRMMHSNRVWDAYAKERGHANWKAYYAADQALRAEQATRYTTEVISL